MKIKNLAVMVTAMMSCALSQQSLAEETKQGAINPDGTTLTYPKARTHQDDLDYFLHGEYGRSSTHVTPSDTSERIRPDDGVNHYFGETVVDKYRWLENIDQISPEYAKETSADRERNLVGTRSENDIANEPLYNRANKALQTVVPEEKSEVTKWVDAQNEVTKQYIQSIPYYQEVRDRLTDLMGRRHRYRQVVKEGVGTIEAFRHEDGYARIVYTDPNGVEHEWLNEANLSDDKNTKIADDDIYVSKDGTYIAYMLRTGNSDSDNYTLHVIETKTGKAMIEPIDIHRSYQDIAWVDDETFYYLGRRGGSIEVHSHTMGSKRINAPVVLTSTHTNASIKEIQFEGNDRRYLIADTWSKTDSFFIKDLQKNKLYRLHNQKYWNKYYKNADAFTKRPLAKYVYLDVNTEDVWLISGENDERGEIIKTNLKNLNKREVVVPALEGYDRILDAKYHQEGEGYFLASYMKDGTHRVVLLDIKGNKIKDLTPSRGYASDLSSYLAKADKEGDKNYVSFRYRSAIMPRTVYKYSIADDEFIDITRRDLYPFVEKDYETKTVIYTSKDGTQVPMTISHKKDLKLDGKNPTVLYGYGGFSSSTSSSFYFDRALWMELGGVWAVANIRGGNEYGEAWHEGGKRLNKMNVFDDFAAAADYLSDNGYATKDYLAISGTSNGGLLVGASMVLSPDKYRVAIPDVGVLDMLRFEDMDNAGWQDEWGVPYDGAKMYKALRGYSPYHNLKAGICYPSTLVYTSKRDDRVVPSHSYKFAAALQDVESCGRPALLYAAELHGHHPHTWNDRIDQYSMQIAFRLHEMGIKQLPPAVVRPSAEELQKGQIVADGTDDGDSDVGQVQEQDNDNNGE